MNSPRTERKNIALAFERVLRELNRPERCLLILDNVSDPNLLQPEFLDRLSWDGRVELIATTRLAPRTIPGSAQEQTFIAVDELPEEDELVTEGETEHSSTMYSPAGFDELSYCTTGSSTTASCLSPVLDKESESAHANPATLPNAPMPIA